MNFPTMTEENIFTRRQYLHWMSAAGFSILAPGCATVRTKYPPLTGPPKSVAAVITAYRHGLHADVLVGKILEGWNQTGGLGPRLTLASMYLDQSKSGDLGLEMANKYDIPIYDTIEDAMTLETDGIAVDGVLNIGEHGSYPWNNIGQHLYPRRRFWEGILGAFEKHGRVVPVFNDKNLGPIWADAKWMYDKAQQMKIPVMAGSSIPLSLREPAEPLPMGLPIEQIVAFGHSGLDIYGIHTLELLQSYAERRKGAETGVKWVQCLQGEAMWRTVNERPQLKAMFEAVDSVIRSDPDVDVRSLIRDDIALFDFEYNDGVSGSVFMLHGYARDFGVAIKLKGRREPLAIRVLERRKPSYPHFIFLLHAIERMIHSGKPSYPVERTLLTGGMLDRLLNSRAQNHRKLETPELAIAYTPVDYPYAPNPALPIMF